MFEIRVAVIGYVSVGKTTVINALFGDKYGEVAMKRTTAVVNSFRISAPGESDIVMADSYSKDSEEDSVEFVADKLTASVTLQETTSDNAAFRASDEVKERSFDISLDQPLHKMRPDTKLVIVDIPGINEAGTSSKYKDYVEENWHTFDVVVVVMDARQGVNTEEQHDLLKLAKDNSKRSKDVPLIILSNKVDDPENEEQLSLLSEARRVVEELFEVNNREKALEATLDFHETKNKIKNRNRRPFFPAVVPISAMHAFVYRCGSRLSFEEFCKMDADFIDKIGKDSYGRQWRRYSKKKQLEMAFKAVSEEEQRQDGLEASNFDVFTKVLAVCIGDEDKQTNMIQKQVEVALERMKKPALGCDLGAELLVANKTLQALGKSTESLPQEYWLSYRRLKRQAFADLKDKFSVKAFAPPIEQLINYAAALKTLKWRGETAKVIEAGNTLVLEYGINVAQSENMKSKAAADQAMILKAMLLPTSDPVFYARFGHLKMHLETLLTADKDSPDFESCPECSTALSSQTNTYGAGTSYCAGCERKWLADTASRGPCPQCMRNGSYYPLSFKRDGGGRSFVQCASSCHAFFVLGGSRMPFEMKVKDGALVPVKPAQFKKEITVSVPSSLDDAEHYGHLFWKYCQLAKEVLSADA